MESIWNVIEKKWPVAIESETTGTETTGTETTGSETTGTGAEAIGLTALKEKVHSFLIENGIRPFSFSHYGFVVKNIDAACAELGLPILSEQDPAQKAWVEAYKVFVLRLELEGTELELIEPAGKSFFDDFLKNEGEGLQHVSFRIEQIQACLDALRANWTETIDATPRIGSHGKVAFTKPGSIAPLYLELCEF